MPEGELLDLLGDASLNQLAHGGLAFRAVEETSSLEVASSFDLQSIS